MNRRPIILVTPCRRDAPEDRDASSEFVKENYLNAILRSGGIPVIVAFGTKEDDLRGLANIAGGLLLPGGADVDPLLYGEAVSEKCGQLASERDELECSLLRIFLELKKPVIGICRGSQIINTVLGGTLYQDIKSEFPSGLCHSDPKLSTAEQYEKDAHEVSVKEESFLYSILGTSKITVNSAHHQAVKKIGEGLRLSATASDGIIEGVESENMEERFILGIQWHPEALLDSHTEQRKIFEKFIEATK